MAALARARKLWKRAGWRFARWMFVGMALTLGGTVLTGVGFTRVTLRTMDSWTMWAMAMGGVMVLTGAVILRLTQGKTPRNAAGELLGERLCPGCLSALRGEADADGLVACGYCGARWRLTPSMSDRSGP